MLLTSEQLAQFHKDGFIVLRHFAKEAMCDTILSVAKRHLEEKIEPIETELGYDSRDKAYRTSVTDYDSHASKPQETVRRLRQVYQRDKHFKAWMENEALRPVLQQILEDNVVITTAHHNSIMTKMPYFSTQTKWHQDRRYWRYSDDNLVSVWLALDEEYSDNGVLEFIPGSHTMCLSEEQLDEKAYFSQSHPANKALMAQKVSTSLHKGDVVIFHSMLLHRANKNSTAKPKISFVYTVKGQRTQAVEGTRSSQFPEIELEWIK